MWFSIVIVFVSVTVLISPSLCKCIDYIQLCLGTAILLAHLSRKLTRKAYGRESSLRPCVHAFFIFVYLYDI